MKDNISDIKLSYIQLHEKYRHISHGQIIYHYVVLIFIFIISLLAVTIVLLDRMYIMNFDVFNREIVSLVLFFPTVLTVLWVIYYVRMVKQRNRLIQLRDTLNMNGLSVCYDANESYPQNVYIKTAEELGEKYKPIDCSEKSFDEYDRVFRLKNKLL